MSENIYGIQKVEEPGVRTNKDIAYATTGAAAQGSEMGSENGAPGAITGALVGAGVGYYASIQGRAEERRAQNQAKSYNRYIDNLSGRAMRTNQYVGMQARDGMNNTHQEVAEIEGDGGEKGIGEIHVDKNYNIKNIANGMKKHEEGGVKVMMEKGDIVFPTQNSEKKHRQVLSDIRKYKMGDETAKRRLDKIRDSLPTDEDYLELEKGMVYPEGVNYEQTRKQLLSNVPSTYRDKDAYVDELMKRQGWDHKTKTRASIEDTTPKSIDDYLKKIGRHERDHGSATNSQLPNYGMSPQYLKSKGLNASEVNKWSEDEFADFMKNEYKDIYNSPTYSDEVKAHLIDYSYNTGRNVNQLLAFADGQITHDQIKGTGAVDLSGYKPSDHKSEDFLNKIINAKNVLYTDMDKGNVLKTHQTRINMFSPKSATTPVSQNKKQYDFSAIAPNNTKFKPDETAFFDAEEYMNYPDVPLSRDEYWRANQTGRRSHDYSYNKPNRYTGAPMWRDEQIRKPNTDNAPTLRSQETQYQMQDKGANTSNPDVFNSLEQLMSRPQGQNMNKSNVLYNLMKGTEPADRVTRRNFIPEEFVYNDRSERQRQATIEQRNTAMRAMSNRVDRAGQLGTMGQLGAQYLRQMEGINERESGLERQVNQQNVGLRNQAKQINLQNALQFDIQDAQNKAAQQSFTGMGMAENQELNNLGQQRRYMMQKDANAARRDRNAMRYIGSSNYGYDSQGNLIYR